MFIFLHWIFNFSIMTNKDFLKMNEHQFINLDSKYRTSIHIGLFTFPNVKFTVYYLERKILSGFIKFGKRGFSTELSYIDFQSCKFSPYELQRWVPSSFANHTNYFNWLRSLSLDVDYIIDKNPNLILPC